MANSIILIVLYPSNKIWNIYFLPKNSLKKNKWVEGTGGNKIVPLIKKRFIIWILLYCNTLCNHRTKTLLVFDSFNNTENMIKNIKNIFFKLHLFTLLNIASESSFGVMGAWNVSVDTPMVPTLKDLPFTMTAVA